MSFDYGANGTPRCHDLHVGKVPDFLITSLIKPHLYISSSATLLFQNRSTLIGLSLLKSTCLKLIGTLQETLPHAPVIERQNIKNILSLQISQFNLDIYIIINLKPVKLKLSI